MVICEGASDAAALLTMGVYGVGRPSNTVGADDLAEWAFARKADIDAGRLTVVVLGENDRKPSGDWPGFAGAKKVSERVAAAVPVRWAMPPDKAKDVRAWLNAQPADADPNELGRRFLANLDWMDRKPVPTAKLPADYVPAPQLIGGTPPLETWPRPDGKDCPALFAAILSRRAERFKLAYAAFRCKSWRCRVCNPLRRVDAAEAVGFLVCSAGGPVYAFEAAAEKVEAAKARCQAKCGGCWLAVRTGPAAPALFITTAPVSGRGYTAVQVRPERALALAEDRLYHIDPTALPHRFRPFTLGQAWKEELKEMDAGDGTGEGGEEPDEPEGPEWRRECPAIRDGDRVRATIRDAEALSFTESGGRPEDDEVEPGSITDWQGFEAKKYPDDQIGDVAAKVSVGLPPDPPRPTDPPPPPLPGRPPRRVLSLDEL